MVMNRTLRTSIQLVALAWTTFFCACRHGIQKKQEPLAFQALEKQRTGLDFSNKLTPTQEFNVFKYMYFYNGAGVGAGDFNNDGKIDLFFSSNQGNNTLYLNKGKMHFEDVSAEAKIPKENAWNTGVSVADVNNDGIIDIGDNTVAKPGDKVIIGNSTLTGDDVALQLPLVMVTL